MKKFLLVGLISLFGLISFGKAETVSSLLNSNTLEDVTVSTNWTKIFNLPSDFAGTFCVKFNFAESVNLGSVFFRFGVTNLSDISETGISDTLQLTYYGAWHGNYVCTYTSDGYNHVFLRSVNSVLYDVDIEYFVLNDLLLEDIPLMTTEQCQQTYSLMPIDSCNSEYCELNGLCEVIGGSGSSTLYINDVRHESAPFIYVNIPEEFKRDYLTGEQEFTINVEGLNGDQDYINGIIDVNSYRPSSEDFTQTFVGGLTLIFPYIIITAVILFIWRFIRKIFK